MEPRKQNYFQLSLDPKVKHHISVNKSKKFKSDICSSFQYTILSIIKKKCELIGSGYSQIIGPLVPEKVSIKNLEIGTEFQIHPKIEVGKSIVTMDEIKNKFNLDYFNFDRETFYIAPTEKLISDNILCFTFSPNRIKFFISLSPK